MDDHHSTTVYRRKVIAPLSPDNRGQLQPRLAKCKMTYSASERCTISPHLAFWQEQTAVLLNDVCVCEVSSVTPVSQSAALQPSVSPINSTLLSVSISPSSSNPVFTLFFPPIFTLHPHFRFICSPSIAFSSAAFPPGAQQHLLTLLLSPLFSRRDSHSPFCFPFLVLSFVLTPPPPPVVHFNSPLPCLLLLSAHSF